MSSITVDTHKIIEQLMASGFKEQQAKALLDAVLKISEAQEPVSQAQLHGFHSDMRDDLKSLEMSLKGFIGDKILDLTRWMFTGFMAVMALLVTVLIRMSS